MARRLVREPILETTAHSRVIHSVFIKERLITNTLFIAVSDLDVIDLDQVCR